MLPPSQIILVSVVALIGLSSSHPQYYPTQPEFNWRDVILSRNGPSTSTTPRPTRWTTTTLRNFAPDTISGTGKGVIEPVNNNIGRRSRNRFDDPGAAAYPQRSAAAAGSFGSSSPLAIMSAAAIVLLITTRR